MAQIKKQFSASGIAMAQRAQYWGYVVTVAVVTNPITIYDNASAASGTVIDVIPTGTVAGTARVLPSSVPCDNGIYVSIAGTGTILAICD